MLLIQSGSLIGDEVEHPATVNRLPRALMISRVFNRVRYYFARDPSTYCEGLAHFARSGFRTPNTELPKLWTSARNEEQIARSYSTPPHSNLGLKVTSTILVHKIRSFISVLLNATDKAISSSSRLLCLVLGDSLQSCPTQSFVL
jgi:hypothetical protein